MEKVLILGKIKGSRRKKQQRSDGIIDSMDMSLSILQEIVKEGSLEYRSPWGDKESDMTDQLNNNKGS